MHVTIASWNVLADCYVRGINKIASADESLSLSSHLRWSHRQEALQAVLQQLMHGREYTHTIHNTHNTHHTHSTHTHTDASHNTDSTHTDPHTAHITHNASTNRVDIFCLQEVDHFEDFYRPLFDAHAFQAVYLQRPGKKDGCCIAFDSARFFVREIEEINLDTLSESFSDSLSVSLSLSTKFARQNVALIVLLHDRETEREVIVCTCHLYWNPNMPEVKFAQALHVCEQLQAFQEKHKLTTSTDGAEKGPPIILCGDFNSFPQDEVYELITHAASSEKRRERQKESLHQSIYASSKHLPLFGPKTKFLCEPSLAKLCRWMRMLGVNVAMDSWETAQSSKNSSMDAEKRLRMNAFFQKARDEKRVILTASRTLRERSNCPQSVYVNPSKTEDALVELYQAFGLDLNRERFLTVCGKCGGEIEAVEPGDARLLGKIYPTDREVFCCVECAQPYWWSEEETSTPAKAMKKAEELFELISTRIASTEVSAQSRAITLSLASSNKDRDVSDALCERVKESLTITDGAKETEIHTLSERFAVRDRAVLMAQEQRRAEKEREEKRNYEHGEEEEDIPTTDSDQTTALDQQTSSSSSPLPDDSQSFVLKSIFGSKEKEPPMTNWNGEFKGTLDYIFVDPSVRVEAARVIPRVDTEALSSSFSLLESEPSVFEKVICSSQPSPSWPSDHFMLLARINC